MSETEKIARLNRLYAVSSGINEAIVRIPDVQRLYEQACRIAVERGGFMMAWVGRENPAQSRLEPLARWGQDDGYIDSIRISTSSGQRAGQGPGGTAFRSGEASVCNDIQADTDFFAFRAEALAKGYRSCAAVPIKLEGRPVAVFFVYAAEPLYFDDEELRLLTSLAENFSFAIESREKEAGRRRADEALRASEARLKVVVERLEHNQALLGMASRLGRIGAWEVELPALAVTWSEELSVILEIPTGYSPTVDEAIAFYTPEHQGPVTDAFARCLRDGVPFDLELEVITGRGRRLSVRSMGEAVRDASGAICRVQGAFQDISDRKGAQEEIRQLADQLATTLESITDALVTVDKDWRFTYVNGEAERVLRRSRGELLGTNMWEQFPQGRGSAFERAYQRALGEGRTVEIQEYYPPLNTWLEVRAYPSTRKDLTIYFRDIGERQAAQQEILRLNAELEQRVRQRTAQLETANHELQAFSYSVAHDLRAPLAAIGGFGYALEKELGASLGERAQHYLTRMREGALRTSDMIDALLSLAQLARTEVRWDNVDLTAIAAQAAQSCREQSPGRNVACRIQAGLRAYGDARLLALVMDNLLGNAWKFTAGNRLPEVDVGCQLGPEGETIYFVRDNGIGFDMSCAGKLFGAFQRLHPPSDFPGWGIGLANVRRIVSRHSGRIWAHSTPGRGATLYFTLGGEHPLT